MPRRRWSDHDALYHRLFGHPEVVAELLRAFVDAALLAGLDLDRIEHLGTKFHAETGQRREGDMVWRIPRADGSASYLMLLLEFQSATDGHMAVRILAYAGLLWQHLARERRLGSGRALPPVLPVVLHHGTTRWRAPQTLRALFDLPKSSPLWPWQPELRYYLIDAGAFSAAELAAREGLPALWFRLQNVAAQGDLAAVGPIWRPGLPAIPDSPRRGPR